MKQINKFLSLLVLSLVLCAITQAQTDRITTRINITKISVYEKDAKLMVEWSTDAKVPTNNWEIQRSTGGSAFTTIALVLGPDPRQSGDQYQYREKMIAGKTTYRVCHIDALGVMQFSELVTYTK